MKQTGYATVPTKIRRKNGDRENIDISGTVIEIVNSSLFRMKMSTITMNDGDRIEYAVIPIEYDPETLGAGVFDQGVAALARHTALEDAARAAEAHDVIDRDMARRIAAAIRDLKEAA